MKAVTHGQQHIFLELLKHGATRLLPAILLLTSLRWRQSIFHQITQDKRAVPQPTWARELVAFFIETINDKRLLDLQDERLNTGLHLAARSQNSEFANALMEAGARSDLVNIYGQSPLDIARDMASNAAGPSCFKAKEMLQLLERRGAVATGKTSVTARAGPSHTDRSESDAMAIWKELGFEDELAQWLDTALIPILLDFRQACLALFRSEGFLLQQNPWRLMTKTVFSTLLVNQAIVAREDRTRQFEYAAGELLRGFVGAVEVKPISDGDNVEIRLVKLVDGIPKLPPNLLLVGDNITSMVIAPAVVLAKGY